jgi:rod shape-determining protein MreB and related proteins
MAHGFDAAVDLGTGYVRVVAGVGGVMVEEPSIVPTPHGPAFLTRPLARGVIADVEAAGRLLAAALRRARGPRLRRPRVLACVPSDATSEETELLRVALERAGAHPAAILSEPVAGAVGAGLTLALPYAQFVVDVGDGVTDAVVIREGRIEAAGAVRVACADLRQAIAQRVEHAHGVLVSDEEAQRVLEIVGVGRNGSAPDPVAVRGMRPGSLTATEALAARAELRAVLEPPLEAITEAVRSVWRHLTDEASCEVVEGGICLTGGGARLHGLAGRLREATGLDVHVADQPSHAVIRGASRMAGLW